MSAEALFRQALLADAGVAQLLTELYSVQLPQNTTFPAAAYQRISTVPKQTHSDALNVSKQLDLIRFQITITAGGANGGALAGAIADAITAALRTFSLSRTPGTIDYNACSNFILNRRHTVDGQTRPALHKTVLDVSVWYAHTT
jgi:hypothetical protein